MLGVVISISMFQPSIYAELIQAEAPLQFFERNIRLKFTTGECLNLSQPAW